MTVEITRETFLSLYQPWEELLPFSFTNTIFVTPWWQQTWWDSLGASNGAVLPAELFLLALRQGQELIGIAPLLRRGTAICFLGDTDLFDYHDFIVRQGQEGAFYSALLGYMATQEWTEFRLPSVPEDSPTLISLPSLAQRQGWQCTIELEGVSPGLPLPESWDHYISGLNKKNRHELRRKIRRLYGMAQPRIYSCSSTGSEEEKLDAFLLLMRQGRPDKQHFLTPEREGFFRAICLVAARLQMLRLYFLDLDGEPVAAALCFDYDGHRFLYNSGFSLKHASLSVGLLLKARCLQEAIEQKLTYFDFLRGDEAYKYDLGGRDCPVYQVTVRR